MTGLARVDDLGRRKAEGVSPTDDVAASVAQVTKPVRLLAVEESNHQRPVAFECKQRPPVLAARASTAVKDDRPRGNEPRVQALNAVGDPLVETRDSSGERHSQPTLWDPGARESPLSPSGIRRTIRQASRNRCDGSPSGQARPSSYIPAHWGSRSSVASTERCETDGMGCRSAQPIRSASSTMIPSGPRT